MLIKASPDSYSKYDNPFKREYVYFFYIYAMSNLVYFMLQLLYRQCLKIKHGLY